MTTATVFFVDDDQAVRESMALLLESADLDARCYDSAKAFLEAITPDQPGCLVLDLRMPGMSGLDLQAELGRRDVHLPIIFLTAMGSIPDTVRALKAGAVDFLTKPFDAASLLDCIRGAMERDRLARQADAAMHSARSRLAGLTEREREILDLALSGNPNKVIAGKLGISPRTVEVHRSHIFLKTGTTTLLELARLLAAGRTESEDGLSPG